MAVIDSPHAQPSQTLTPPSVATAAPAKKQVPRRLRKILSLNDFEAAARRYLPHSVFTFVQSGVEEEVTLSDNRTAYRDYHLVPRVLVGVTNRSQKTELFGESYDSPFGVAPMGMESLVGYRGDLMIAQACAASNIPFIQSGASLIRLEDVRAACRTAWFQAYLPLTDEELDGLLARVASAGFTTLVITVDMAAGSNRENTARAGFSAPFRPSWRMFWDGATHPAWSIGNFIRTIVQHGMPHFENLDGGRGAPIVSKAATRNTNRTRHTWDSLRRIRKMWGGRLVVKGLLDPRDVKVAIDCGIDGVIVTTHGGRQIDTVLPALHALPGCVEAADGQVPVMIDSGIRRGTDVVKALALGASFCFIGRPFNYAAIYGQEGVQHGIDLMRAEISRTIGNMGVNRLDEITRDRIVERRR